MNGEVLTVRTIGGRTAQVTVEAWGDAIPRGVAVLSAGEMAVMMKKGAADAAEIARLRDIIWKVRTLAVAHRFVDTSGTGQSGDMDRIRELLELT